MSQFQFDLAGPEDDGDLRHVLAATPMEGRISVRLQREPSWFAGAVVDGRSRQVVACRDSSTGRIIGFGCRSLREVYVNGQPATVGYLSGLRVLPEYRNRGLVARGYAFFRRLHQDGQAPFYLTTIAAGNEPALRTLTSGRVGLPAYHQAGSYHTLAFTLPRRPRTPRAGQCGVTIRPAGGDDLPAVLEFLGSVGPRRQFFPRYQRNDWLTADGLLLGLALEQLLLAERGGRLVGTLAGWDQHGYRQSIVEGYRGWLGWLRPLVNVGFRLRGLPGLPAPGRPLRCLMGALPVVAEDDLGVFAALLEALRQRWAGGPWSHLLLGLHQTDPLWPVARQLASASYTTYLYLVCWQDGETARSALDGRPPYLELGSL